ncbi:MAG: glutathione S-transferase family protein [Bradyrhizobium sp.]|nr:glutathione S-transferase family protein [Bradyrhizobium sp.]
MLTVHHLGVSQSDRIVWLCEELEIPYELVRYDRDPVNRLAPPAYRALHPFGIAPVITDDDLVLGESGAIIDYIIAKYGEGRLKVGPDKPNFPDFLYWFHFANGTLMPATTVDLITSRIAKTGDDAAAKNLVLTRGSRAFDMIDDRLGKAPYFAGDEFTAADIIMLFPLTTMRMFIARDISGLPHLLAYLQRIAARPAFQRAMAKADPGLPLMLS